MKKKSQMMALAILVIIGTLVCFIPTTLACEHQDISTEILSEATCTTDGITKTTCNTCSITYEDITPATGHTLTKEIIITKPGPNKNGTGRKLCDKCEYSEPCEIICQHVNTTDTIEYEATCAEPGVIKHICNECQTETQEEIPTLEHAETVNIITQEATCHTEGIESAICKACGGVANTISIDTKEHTYGNFQIEKYATPFEAGAGYKICSICGHKETEAINITLEPNTLYIPSIDVVSEFAVDRFTQHAVDNNDIIYTVHAYGDEDETNPFVLGHWYGSLLNLHKTKVGEYIYVRLEDTIDVYKIINSEYAVEYETTNQIGQTTGVNIWDTYSSNMNFDRTCYGRVHDGKDRWVIEDSGKTLHMYTCHYGNDKADWEPSHGRNGRWIVLADLVESRAVGSLSEPTE